MGAMFVTMALMKDMLVVVCFGRDGTLRNTGRAVGMLPLNPPRTTLE
jgi:hypothetical protein